MNAESIVESHGYLVGTLFYVAPEQVHGRGAGLRTEIFSFGVMLYEVLTGLHPFRAEHHMSLLYNITQREPEPLATHFPNCPRRSKAWWHAASRSGPKIVPRTCRKWSAAWGRS